MKTLIDRFKEEIESDEIDTFINKLSEVEEGKQFQEMVEKADHEELKTYVAANFIMKTYLLAKMSEMSDKVTELERKVTKCLKNC